MNIDQASKTLRSGFARMMARTGFTIVATLFGALLSHAQPLAFPEAEGYGKNSVGGRGGTVYEVTNLNASGAGSLGAAIAASGPRTVVFRVSGTIAGSFTITNDKITIAGQTAPGDGICIKGNLKINANDVIIRYIRVRADPTVGAVDAVYGEYRKNIILDHVSASWSSDETLSIYRNEYVTIQWCMITEGCGRDGGHRFGGIWGNNYGTYHHNLFAHNESRNPRWAPGSKYNDFRNNVLYNWKYQTIYGGEGLEDSDPNLNFFTVNMVANYYKSGPGTDSGVRSRVASPGTNAGGVGSWYISGNYINGFPAVTADNWQGVEGSNYIRLNTPWAAMAINQQTPADAYSAVLAHGGCSKPRRDSVDTRIMNEVANGTATYGTNGIITLPSDVGGWPALASGTPPADTDHDGMPDAWETAHGLNPNDASDRNGDLDGDGYTNLEEYLNELGAFGGSPVNNPPSVSISSPANGASFTAPTSIAISASASDTDGTISSVSFYQGSTLLTTDNVAPYAITWSNVAAGSYSLTARATDNAGATTTSAAVNVTVNPGANNPPSVAISSPASGATYTAPASVTIDANASDSDGSITSVAFYQGSTLLATDTAAPYSFTWSNVAAGSYSLTARATDNAGATTTSAAVNVTVNPGSGGGGSSTLQAETASTGGGVTIDNNNAGFNGTGFVNFPGTGGFVQFNNVGGGTGGATTLAVRYALGATSARTARLLVNGVAQNITFNPTGSWTTWTSLTVNITLNSGTTNTVRIESTGQDAGNIDEITVTPSTGGNTPPTVLIAAPASGATYTAPASVTIDANASDSDGSITSVAFYQGSTLLGTDTSAPYSFTWSNVAAGTYSLTARATDNGGATTTSAAVNVTVTSGGGGSPTPLIKIGFNENTGTSVGNAGSASATFTKTTPPAWSTNVPTSGGTSSVDFGTTTGNYCVESSAVVSQLAGLSSFTVTGWVNNRSSSQGAGGNRVVSWINNGANGVDIVYKSNGALQLGINQWPDSSPAVSNASKITTNSSAPASNWRFFAITYDASTGVVNFYFGDNAAAATLDKTVTYSRGAVGSSIGKLAIGHFNAESSRSSRADRMFRGLIDQVEIHGSVLTLAQIQTIQTAQ